ncbi:DegV family protein [Clostridium botulinum]|uniref:DegV family protein n=1 Tax=Clostridium botulinum TaxID=1491 RepID=A0A6B4JQT2_CLOBO|nr:DegV family protein [Clostridium botulinum]EES48640.1 DegV family protein [Clostridium botulinum E1 str. 'BoNT E Beluga']MBY6761230.1 DegV family protein [Clostridium botulinum]MBY6921292.1 DegV family protein [Clostridium botulinum]MCR1132145.1 DegV family protein [Clostridium botulinum]NFJ59299.1 DegV family protein [Clostridium botulinum]
MKKFIITTDTTADLPKEYFDENNIGLLTMSFQMDGKEYVGDEVLDIKDFYDKMRSGSMPTTAQVNPEQAKIQFEKYLKEGYDVLHICFSSGLSGSFNSTRIASIELEETYPDNKVIVIDSLSVSSGEGLLVYKAVDLKKNGKNIEEIAAWLEENKLNVCQYFTVDDLNHLYRGGRVSKTTAILGTVIGVKPIIHVDNEGKLIPISKTRGRKQSLAKLLDNMEKLMGSYKCENDIIFVSHGDAEKDAEIVANKIRERFGIESIMINNIGPIIGTHSGPGTVAVFFMGENR